ncbi:MAG: hypothetical protein AAGF11_03885 [Myxococcota bacterium]
MAYRPDPEAPLSAVQALQAAQLELWLADSLVTERRRTKRVRLRYALVAALSLFVGCTASVVDVGSIVEVAFIVLVSMWPIGWWIERGARVLKREARRRGMSRRRLRAIEQQEDLGDELVEHWRMHCRDQVRRLASAVRGEQDDRDTRSAAGVIDAGAMGGLKPSGVRG